MKSQFYAAALAAGLALAPMTAHADDEAMRPPSAPKTIPGELGRTVSGNVASNLKLQSTTIERRNYAGAGLAAGSYWMDTQHNIACPPAPAGNCVIEASIVVQASSQSASSNRVSVCPYIDNKVFNPTGSCPILGIAPVGLYQAFSFPWAQYNVTPGTHKLRSAAQFDSAVFLSYVSIRYDVYK